VGSLTASITGRADIRVPDMTNVFRTPEDRFADLPDFPFAAHYSEWSDLRLARVDEGHGAPVVFLHGEPTWSFLWRKVIGPVLEAGYRCIAPDLPGFGRSDKPTAIEWYTYDRHTEAMAALVEELDLRGATLVVHDWGGPIGLRLAVEQPDRFDRVVIMDTGLFTGHQKMSDAWIAFRDFVARTEDLPVGFLVRGACHIDPGEEVIAAYEAPFPTVSAKAGARAFPLILPTSPEAPGAAAGQRVLEALRGDGRPKLVLWADSDPILTLSTGRRFAEALGTSVDHVIEGAGHFLQEDAGRHIGELIADWLRA
jgi:haloalkane dehalogenase